MRYFPDLDRFRAAAAEADVIPVARQLFADHFTAVTAFEILGREDHAFLFEATGASDGASAEFSFIGTAPSTVLVVFDGRAALLRVGEPPQEFLTADPLADLQRLLPQRRFWPHPALPSFTGGLVGFAGYDLARYYCREELPLPPKDDRRLPDAVFGLYSDMVIFHHAERTISVVSNADVSAKSDLESAYKRACHRVDEIVRRLQQPSISKVGQFDPNEASEPVLVSNLTAPQFADAVRVAQQQIRSGCIELCVPTVRFRVSSAARPLEVYRALRVLLRSSGCFYMKSPVCVLMGSDLQILIKKECAGYAVAIDLLRGSIPAPHWSGSPRMAAMRVIDEVEPCRRGPSAAAVGYLDFAGNLQFWTTPDLVVWHNGAFDVQAGVNVDLHCDPLAQHARVAQIAGRMLRAVPLAQNAFR